MTRRVSVFTLIVGVALAVPTRAEKAPLSPEQLRKTATHVVIGEVTAIYTRSETAGDWQYTRYVAEVRVGGKRKGRWAEEGRSRLRTVLASSMDQSAETGTEHQWALGPAETRRELRIYMAKNAYDGFTEANKDGGFNVIGCDGFERLKPAGK